MACCTIVVVTSTQRDVASALQCRRKGRLASHHNRSGTTDAVGRVCRVHKKRLCTNVHMERRKKSRRPSRAWGHTQGGGVPCHAARCALGLIKPLCDVFYAKPVATYRCSFLCVCQRAVLIDKYQIVIHSVSFPRHPGNSSMHSATIWRGTCRCPCQDLQSGYYPS
jgi:hypothetical protein